MTKRKQNRETSTVSVGVTQKPWWNQPLIQTVLAGVFMLLGALIAWYLGKPNSISDERIWPFSLSSYLDYESIKIKFSKFDDDEEQLVDVLLPLHLNGNTDTNIFLETDKENRRLVGSYRDKSRINLILQDLSCNKTYFLQVKPNDMDKNMFGSFHPFKIPPCSSVDDRKSLFESGILVVSFNTPNEISEN